MAFNRKSLQKRSVSLNKDGAVGPENLAESIRSKRWCFENFMQEPIQTKVGALAAPAGTALQACLVNTGNYNFQWATLADESDEFYILLASEGGYNLTIAAISALGDGIEVNFGGDLANHPRCFTTTSEDWFARVLFSLDDASGSDVFFGAKKAAASVATLTEVVDIFGLRILGDSSSTTGTFTILSNQNNAGTTDYTSTTTAVTGLEDATDVELEIRGVNGKMYLYVNGAIVPNLTWTADSGDAFAPILRVSYTTDANTITGVGVRLYGFECGLMADRTDGKLIDLVRATA